MIEVATVLSALIKHWVDFIIILVLLLANAVVGVWEEFQAGNAIAAPKETLAPKARVKRDGHWREVPSRELVPGELLRLRLGDIVPADVKLLEGDTAEMDQPVLTGESLPVEKKSGEAIYSVSILKKGEIDVSVSGTERSTYFVQDRPTRRWAHTVSYFQQAVQWLAQAGLHLQSPPVLVLALVALSNLINNATAVPLLLKVANVAHQPAVLVLMLANRFGGSLLILGNVSNIIVVQQARKLGIRISFRDFARLGVPVTLAALAGLIVWLLMMY